MASSGTSPIFDKRVIAAAGLSGYGFQRIGIQRSVVVLDGPILHLKCGLIGSQRLVALSGLDLNLIHAFRSGVNFGAIGAVLGAAPVHRQRLNRSHGIGHFDHRPRIVHAIEALVRHIRRQIDALTGR